MRVDFGWMTCVQVDDRHIQESLVGVMLLRDFSFWKTTGFREWDDVSWRQSAVLHTNVHVRLMNLASPELPHAVSRVVLPSTSPWFQKVYIAAEG